MNHYLSDLQALTTRKDLGTTSFAEVIGFIVHRLSDPNAVTMEVRGVFFRASLRVPDLELPSESLGRFPSPEDLKPDAGNEAFELQGMIAMSVSLR